MITAKHSQGCDKKTPRSPDDPTVCCQGEQEEVPDSEIEDEQS